MHGGENPEGERYLLKRSTTICSQATFVCLFRQCKLSILYEEQMGFLGPSVPRHQPEKVWNVDPYKLYVWYKTYFKHMKCYKEIDAKADTECTVFATVPTQHINLSSCKANLNYRRGLTDTCAKTGDAQIKTKGRVDQISSSDN